MTKHTYPLPVDKIFKYQWKPLVNSISAIIIDLEEFLPVFFDNVKKISEKYHWDLDYYLLEVLSNIHEKLYSLKYWPIYFCVYSDFILYLHPKRYSQDLEKSELYSGTDKETNHFRKVVFTLFEQIKEDDDYYLRILHKAHMESVRRPWNIIFTVLICQDCSYAMFFYTEGKFE